MVINRKKVQKELDSIKNIRQKIDRMNEICRDVCTNDSEWGEELAREAQEYSRKAGYPRGEALALANKGHIRGLQSLLDEAIGSFEKAAAILRGQSGEEQRGLNIVLLGLGKNLTKQERYSEAALILREALNLSEVGGDVRAMGQIYINLSVISGTLCRLDESITYLLKAVEILEHTAFYDDLAVTLNNLGYVYNLQGHFDKAVEILKRACKLTKKKKLTTSRRLLMITMFKVYLNMGEYDKAIRMYRKNKKTFVKEKRPLNKAYLHLHLASLFEKKDDFKSALKYAIKARKIINNNALNFIKKDIYRQLYQIYKKNGRFKKALLYHEVYVEHEKLNNDKEIDKNIKNVEADSLREANRRIGVISEIGRNITASLDVTSVIDRIYKSVNSLMDAPYFGIASYNRHTGGISHEMYVEKGEHLKRSDFSINDKNSLAAYVIRNRKEIIINDLENEFDHYIPGQKPHFIGNNQNVQSVLFVPLQTGEKVNGVITAQSFQKNAYSLHDLEALKALASYIAIGLNNARQSELIQQQNRELNVFHKKTKTDLMMARKLQSEMIPAVFPSSFTYTMYGYYHPIDELGGDLYDVYRISEDKTAVFILDVVGHGVYAALITAMAKVLFNNKSNQAANASSIVEAVNREITPITADSFTYFSLFFGIINSKDHTLEYVNAAHPEPFVIKKDQSVEHLGSSSLFIGLKGDYLFERKTISLDPGDRLVMYTDGCFELQGKNKKRYGEKRLLETFIKTKSLSPEKAVKKLNQEITLFQKGYSPAENDDRAMLIVDFNE